MSLPLVDDVSDVPGERTNPRVILLDGQYVRLVAMRCGLCEYQTQEDAWGPVIRAWIAHAVSHTRDYDYEVDEEGDAMQSAG